MHTVEMSSTRSTELIRRIELGIEVALKDIFATMFNDIARVVRHTDIV